jgi:surfeit locus 1 family protein
MPFRPALLPTLFTVPAILVLLGLGTWQVQRLAWKNEIVDRIAERIQAPAVPLPAAGVDADAMEYRRVTVSGTFLHDREAHLVATSVNGNPGYHVVTPLQRPDGGAVLVNRGWVPQDRKASETRREGQVAGVQTLEGVVRKPWSQGWFVPDNDPVRNIWFFGDAADMQHQMGVTAPPLFVEAVRAPNPGGFPIGGQTRVNIPNNHLSYAVTWYGFALALIAIYVIWHRRERRL